MFIPGSQLRTLTTLTPLVTSIAFTACSGDGVSRPKDGGGGAAGRLLEPSPDAGVPDTVPPEVGTDVDLGVNPMDGFTAGTGGMAGNAGQGGADAGRGGFGGIDASGQGGALTAYPYRFSLFYHEGGTVRDLFATGVLSFASDDCRLEKASFTGLTADFTGALSEDPPNFCQPAVTLVLSGASLEGVTIRLRNRNSDPNDVRSWLVDAECSGQGFSECSGRLDRID